MNQEIELIEIPITETVMKTIKKHHPDMHDQHIIKFSNGMMQIRSDSGITSEVFKGVKAAFRVARRAAEIGDIALSMIEEIRSEIKQSRGTGRSRDKSNSIKNSIAKLETKIIKKEEGLKTDRFELEMLKKQLEESEASYITMPFKRPGTSDEIDCHIIGKEQREHKNGTGYYLIGRSVEDKTEIKKRIQADDYDMYKVPELNDEQEEL